MTLILSETVKMNQQQHPQDTWGCASVSRREASCASGSNDSLGAQQASKPYPACLGILAFPFLRRKQAFCLQGRSKERHMLHPQKYPSHHPRSPWPPRPSLSHLGAHPRSLLIQPRHLGLSDAPGAPSPGFKRSGLQVALLLPTIVFHFRFCIPLFVGLPCSTARSTYLQSLSSLIHGA